MALPKITVLMLVYNGEDFIKKAIDSILYQTYHNFELLIINDGSTDNSLNIINGFNDSRIRILNNDGNKGLTYSRNRGVKEAKGEYIAIIDCDDINEKSRLEKQLNFLEKNPEFAVIGSMVQSIDHNGNFIGKPWDLSAPHEKIPCILLFRNYIANPAAMFRKNVFKSLDYRSEYPPAEDYDLWVRISENYKLWNIQKILLYYRVHDANISSLKLKKRHRAERNILQYQLRLLPIVFSEEELSIHHSLSIHGKPFSKTAIQKVAQWLTRLDETNAISHHYHTQYFKEVLAEEWYNACKQHGIQNGFWIIITFYSSKRLKYLRIGISRHIKFIIKAIIFQFKSSNVYK